MFYNELLQTHLETSPSIKNRSAIIAEWNMNIPDNISLVGNYRYRKTSTNFKNLPVQFDPDDVTHKDATLSTVAVDNGVNDEIIPIAFAKQDKREHLYYSLYDCLGKFRPRSGINKIRYMGETKTQHFVSGTIVNGIGQSYLDTNRPRYYAADKTDKFKYWTSFRFEGTAADMKNNERGVANRVITGLAEYGIDDAVPFVVYKNKIPTNKIVVKMQTNVGTVTTGNIVVDGQTIPDPLYGASNKTTPIKWRIQGLVDNNWEDLKTFDSNSIRRNNKPIIPDDGYVELAYGLIVPEEYRNIFIKAETYSTTNLLPAKAVNGYSYLIKTSPTDVGTYYIWIDAEQKYKTFTPIYGWDVAEETIDRFSHFVTDVTSPDAFINTTNQFRKAYREFQYLQGIRIVVETMNKFDSTFDLIEMSTRLVVNLSDKTKSISVKKAASDLGISGLPVGQLLVSTGSIELFDFDDSFNVNNKTSIISEYATNQIQFKFYDIIAEVLENGVYYDYYVPLKTLYGDGNPQFNIESRTVSMELRDMFSYFESFTAPQILAKDASLSYAVSFLLDNIGFSNYVFKRTATDVEPIIPFFYVEPDVTVAEILNELARSTQTAMFFDEYNNFVMMSKNYMLPSETDRGVDTILHGSKDFDQNGVVKNKTTNTKLANIINIASQDTEVYNDGKINFTTRYIEKSYSSIDQANKLDKDKTWTYKPSLLWEVSPSDSTKAVNEESSSLSTYALTAIPLKTDLTTDLPKVVNGEILNNIIEFGDAVYWMARYAGYFYANGEVIKYDAVEYTVPGIADAVWISTLDEYKNYFSQIPFNGKMYPTGRVRIYTQPFYNKTTGNLQDGNVEKHGRGQFDTAVVYHKAGMAGSEWLTNISGVSMDSDYLFSVIGNFQLKNAFVPYKATQQIKFFGSGKANKTWSISAPGEYTSGSGNTGQNADIKTVVLNKLQYDKEYTYTLKVNDIEVYSIKQKMETILNADNQTKIGDLVINDITYGSGGAPTIATTITLPSFASFFKKGEKLVDSSFGFSLTASAGNSSISGTITQGTKQITDPKNKKNKITVSDYTKTVITIDGVAKPQFSGSSTTIDVPIAGLSKTVMNQISLSVGTTEVKTISLLPNDATAILLPQTSISLYADNRTICVDDTSGIKIGQKVMLYKNDSVLSGTTVVSVNPFDADNANELRIASIDDADSTFKVRHKANATGGISVTQKGMEYITFYDMRNISSNPANSAGTTTGTGKQSATLATEAFRTGIIKNFLSSGIEVTDADIAKSGISTPGTVQASALIMTGPGFANSTDPASIDFVSYAYKDLSTNAANYKCFGTRMRLVGDFTSADSQSGIGEDVWYTNKHLSSSTGISASKEVKASSAGLAVLLNAKTNTGYYFEIAALSDTTTARSVIKYSEDGTQLDDPLHNVLFYKVAAGLDEDGNLLQNEKSIPTKLWGGLANILVDDGTFVGQGRSASGTSNSVYDLSVEYEIVNKTQLKFYLYINNILVGQVIDENPLKDSSNNIVINSNMALFVRGKSKAMFENVYALASNPATDKGADVISQSAVNKLFSSDSITYNELVKKYSVSGIVSSSYLQGITANSTNKSLYFDEFGTIMREAAYFNVRYDKSYPALLAQLAPTYNNTRGFVTSGFIAGPYSAEFLIFNMTDTVLYLDGSNGNYLRLQGITFTSQGTHELTVDEYFAERSNLSDPQKPVGATMIISPAKETQEYNRIRNSRATYGKKEFTLDTRYIQSQDTAKNMMGWIISKIMKPRKSVGLKVFAMPTIQLGDIVKIDMKDASGNDQIVSFNSRFVVYQIDYSKTSSGPDMTVYVSEVV